MTLWITVGKEVWIRIGDLEITWLASSLRRPLALETVKLPRHFTMEEGMDIIIQGGVFLQMKWWEGTKVKKQFAHTKPDIVQFKNTLEGFALFHRLLPPIKNVKYLLWHSWPICFFLQNLQVYIYLCFSESWVHMSLKSILFFKNKNWPKNHSFKANILPEHQITLKL